MHGCEEVRSCLKQVINTWATRMIVVNPFIIYHDANNLYRWAISQELLSPTCSHNMVNFSLLAAEICWRVWGTPANFNGFRVLAALLHGTLVVGVRRTLRCWKEGATYIRQDGHHVGHWLSSSFFSHNPSDRRFVVCHNSAHGVALVRI